MGNGSLPDSETGCDDRQQERASQQQQVPTKALYLSRFPFLTCSDVLLLKLRRFAVLDCGRLLQPSDTVSQFHPVQKEAVVPAVGFPLCGPQPEASVSAH